MLKQPKVHQKSTFFFTARRPEEVQSDWQGKGKGCDERAVAA